ncbi:MAG TPA: hypothetical protein VN714_28410 [Trebonia sp.]|jgi:hypothetical protein|nr:hypothetical protein [Trebonia sp.]
MKRSFGLILLAAALTAAGCGSVHAPAATPAQPAAHPGPTSTQSLTPQQRAEAGAADMLKSFAVPPGGRQVQSPPLANAGVLKHPNQVPGDPDLVDRAAWFTAPGAPADVLAWEKQHIPHEFTWTGNDSVSPPPLTEPVSTDMYSLPPVDDVLDSRQLLVEVVRDGANTAIRIDAQVTWLPARTASDQVPAQAKAVTITMNPDPNQGGKKPLKTTTVTDPAKVQKLAALINSLPVYTPGLRGCLPDEIGASLTLTFRASPQGPPLAAATSQLSNCQDITLTIGGKSQPDLRGTIGPKVLKAAALPWTIPSR